MRFDPQGGFDDDARAAIAALLPPGADLSSAIAALEMAGRFYINIKRRKPRKAAAERKHYDEGAKWPAWLIAWLVHEAERDPWPKQYIEMCAAVDPVK